MAKPCVDLPPEVTGLARTAHTLDDLARLAAGQLPADVWDFVQGGSGEDGTVLANRAALDSIRLRPRVLAEVAEATGYCRLLNAESALPLAVAPMAYQKMMHPRGEVDMALAAYEAGVPIALSTLSSRTIEDVCGTGAVVWFQLYWLRDRDAILGLVRRAERAGCRAVMVTVDVPVMGRRLRDIRNRFAVPEEISAINLPPVMRGGGTAAKPGTSAVAAHTGAVFDPGMGWSDLDWLREVTDLPLIVKGIMDPEDADRAVSAGADAIVVSNHGGRQLEGALPSILALADVVDAVSDRCEILFDSGVRSGTDILRALALGASGVLVGRPMLWGLAVDGARGAARALEILRVELEFALALAGCPNVLAARRLDATVVPGLPFSAPFGHPAPA
ncbi:alpha-hydroxy acid oxidase [Paractinoplanes ovalisporus]|uniref:alpha-hydroxy acid oxidase n=1 Tax=Paractinoplanes ovalisporus TaxID=2810368 RepID=UPI003F68D247